jgi:hypothetical protein
MATKQGWAQGGTIFAATLLMIIGVYQFFMGLAAVARDSFFVVGPNYYYQVDTTAWGWIHMGIGVVAVVAGFFLFTGAMWARVIGIAIAAISAIANFFFVPYYPIWSLLLIAVDIFCIWAIATVRPVNQFEPDQTAMYGGAGTPGFQGEASQSGGRWPQENVAAGRHWAPEGNVKEGVGQTGQPDQSQAAAEAQERAAAAARGTSGGGTYTGGPGGVTPPNPPTGPQQ